MSIPVSSFEKLPSKPGVYILKNAADAPVYVGKATSIRSRASAHLRPRPDDPIGQALKEQIKSADYIATQTPIEALILENVLIKRHRPRYNIRLKDDKSYPYIKVTNELYPRVFVTRQITEDGSRYFGPYGNVRAAKRSVKYLRRLFPVRSCTLPLDGVKKFKSCLDYNLGLCKAPCIFAVSKSEHDSDVKKFQLFLEGKLVQLSKDMYGEMWSASKAQDFEKARKLRDEIKSLETTALKQRIVFQSHREKDVITIARKKEITSAIIFQVRDGKVVGREKFIVEGANSSSKDSEILSAFIKQHYGSAQARVSQLPGELVLPTTLEDSNEIELLLNRSDAKPLRISNGSKSLENRGLLKLAQENAQLVLSEEESKDEVRKRERLNGLKDLKEVLELEKAPRRIECFDISNIHGDES
ncbi:MAG: excinuclease ABC subunit UvrC, partial [Nitrososphaerales archaeon]